MMESDVTFLRMLLFNYRVQSSRRSEFHVFYMHSMESKRTFAIYCE